jgi:hypothetical protein
MSVVDEAALVVGELGGESERVLRRLGTVNADDLTEGAF